MEAPPCMPSLSARQPWWQGMRRYPGDDGFGQFSGVLPLDMRGDSADSEDPFSSYISPYKQVLPRLRTASSSGRSALKGDGKPEEKNVCELTQRKISSKHGLPLPSRSSTFSRGTSRLQSQGTKPLFGQANDCSTFDPVRSDDDGALDLASIFLPDASNSGVPMQTRSKGVNGVGSSRSGSRHLGTRQKQPYGSVISYGKVLPALKATSNNAPFRATSSSAKKDDTEIQMFRNTTGFFNGGKPNSIAASIAISLAERYKDPMGKLQASHAEWRRKHDALVRRKKKQIEESECSNGLDRMASLASLESAPSDTALASMSRSDLLGPSQNDVCNEDPEDIITPIPEVFQASEMPSIALHGAHRQSTCSTMSMLEPVEENPGIVHEKGLGSVVDKSPRNHRTSSKSSALMGGIVSRRTSTQSFFGTGISSRRGTVDDPVSESKRGSAIGRTRSGIIEDDVPKTADSSNGSDQQQEATTTGMSSLHSLKAGKSLLNRQTSDSEAFDRSVVVAKANNLTVEEVHAKWEDFIRFDQTGNGSLSEAEFVEAVREACHVPAGLDVPDHLLQHCWGKADDDGDGKITFEEFVVWSVKTAYSEEVLVPDAKERELRLLARTHGLCLTDVERIKDVFDSFDADHSGQIEECEFRKILLVFMKVKNPADVSDKKLKRYWREVDTDRSGSINFEEFLLWYYRCFLGENI